MAAEIELLGRLPAPIAVPELLKAWGRPLDTQESLAFAWACAMVADSRLVPAVSTLLDPRQWQIRAYAVEALTKIDTEEAASALWPHLDEEADLSRKLRLIAFLGRHGFSDGYAQAIEHLSQPALRDEAVEALGAIGEPKAIPELRRIWQTSNDLAWNAAAIRALARLGQADIAPKLLELARTPGDPLGPSALVGLGDLGSAEALPIVNEALSFPERRAGDRRLPRGRQAARSPGPEVRRGSRPPGRPPGRPRRVAARAASRPRVDGRARRLSTRPNPRHRGSRRQPRGDTTVERVEHEISKGKFKYQ